MQVRYRLPAVSQGNLGVGEVLEDRLTLDAIEHELAPLRRRLRDEVTPCGPDAQRGKLADEGTRGEQAIDARRRRTHGSGRGRWMAEWVTLQCNSNC